MPTPCTSISVLEARSLLEVYYTQPDLSYQDNCLYTYGSYKTDVNRSARSSSYKTETFFNVFPNPVSDEKGINVISSENGSIYFFDNLGRIVNETRLVNGYAFIGLNWGRGVYSYHYTNTFGAIKTGKIVVL